MASNFQLYLYTLDEYRRFSNFLAVKNPTSLSDDYSESDYIGIQVRLMLLRKYFSSGKNPENVSFRRIVAEAISEFPNINPELTTLLQKFDEIEAQQVEHLLSDGTKLNIYTTIEDTVYGLYLHADEMRIENLKKTNELIRFTCIRKYVLEVESIVFQLYDILKKQGVDTNWRTDTSRAPMLYFGNTNKNSQLVEQSPYWKNIYGHDATPDDLEMIEKDLMSEEKEILTFCISFMDEIKKTPIAAKELKKFVHPFARRGWGNFVEAQSVFNNIPNPGFSTKVRYNNKKDIAYVRIFPNVEEALFLDTPHLFSDVYEFALAKWRGKWMIYSFGGHLDSIYKNR